MLRTVNEVTQLESCAVDDVNAVRHNCGAYRPVFSPLCVFVFFLRNNEPRDYHRVGLAKARPDKRLHAALTTPVMCVQVLVG